MHARLSAGHFILQVHFLYRNLSIVPRHASRLKPYLYAMHNCGHFRTPPPAAVYKRPPLVTLELIACARARARADVMTTLRTYQTSAKHRVNGRARVRAHSCTQLLTLFTFTLRRALTAGLCVRVQLMWRVHVRSAYVYTPSVINDFIDTRLSERRVHAPMRLTRGARRIEPPSHALHAPML